MGSCSCSARARYQVATASAWRSLRPSRSLRKRPARARAALPVAARRERAQLELGEPLALADGQRVALRESSVDLVEHGPRVPRRGCAGRAGPGVGRVDVAAREGERGPRFGGRAPGDELDRGLRRDQARERARARADPVGGDRGFCARSIVPGS
ncbi:hypothetical protein G6O69_38865 [Pseudenhygromyxa sp. WMMC2535]|uniref:hypothetical protein n=1 Tax=Pseudenhygromyxa sp. WMMC2535 TaxID=2712867 RepID=UPI0015951E88|nr:hypothetical protein [Pseudenhygromyxa sp. WMMC2535]NVB43821.1 hypothetical protein [Pseudenhygromyxa sp. WMMC2535]